MSESEATQRDFSNFQLADNVFELANGLLPRIAETMNFHMPYTDNSVGERVYIPGEQVLRDFVGATGPDKELQKNIGELTDALGDDAVEVTAGWIETESGMMIPADRYFARPKSAPKKVDKGVFGGGVFRWPLRRTVLGMSLDPEMFEDGLTLYGSTRLVKPGEHQLARRFERIHGHMATENDIMKEYMKPMLELAGHKVDVVEPETANGDKALDYLFGKNPGLLGKSILMLTNTPNSIQAAGQLRLAALRADIRFDSNGDQLSMKGDGAPVARHGEKPDTHQNSISAVGQLARNSLFIYLNGLSAKAELAFN